MRVIQRIIILIIIIAAVDLSAASNFDQKFTVANASYKRGEYQNAINQYEELIAGKYQSAELFYNLGNCYYKTDRIAPAILNYEKAKLLSPGDDDIEFNLRLANMRTTDKIPSSGDYFMEFFHNFRDRSSSTGWGILFIVMIWLTFILFSGFIIIRRIFFRKILFSLSIFCLFLGILSGFLGYSRQKYERNSAEAIIFSAAVPVKSSPEDNGTDLFFLHEGSKVEVIENNENWVKMKILSDKIGWLPKSSIQEISVK